MPAHFLLMMPICDPFWSVIEKFHAFQSPLLTVIAGGELNREKILLISRKLRAMQIVVNE